MFGFSLWKIFYFYSWLLLLLLTSLKHKTKECIQKVCRKDIVKYIGVENICICTKKNHILSVISPIFLFFLWKSNFMIVWFYIQGTRRKIFLCWMKIDDYLSKGEFLENLTWIEIVALGRISRYIDFEFKSIFQMVSFYFNYIFKGE